MIRLPTYFPTVKRLAHLTLVPLQTLVNALLEHPPIAVELPRENVRRCLDGVDEKPRGKRQRVVKTKRHVRHPSLVRLRGEMDRAASTLVYTGRVCAKTRVSYVYADRGTRSKIRTVPTFAEGSCLENLHLSHNKESNWPLVNSE